MLDNCGWTESICVWNGALNERMSGEIDVIAAQGGTVDDNEDAPNLHHGDTFAEEEIAFPQSQGETPASEGAEATANPSTPQEGDGIPRSPGGSAPTLPVIP